MDDPCADRPIRVLLADDEPLIRGGVRAILATDAAVEVVAEAADGREAIDLARRHRPDVVLLDIRMPGLDGLTAMPEIRRAVPGAKIVVLTTFGEDDYIDEALSAGAAGFLLKASDPRELLTGVHAVVDGGAYLSPRVAQRVISRFRSSTARRNDHRVDQLTDREREVLAMLATGLSNAQIGRRLHLVEGTVKGHVSAILTKLGARNRVHAAILAYESGLLPDHR